jgi:hypothetical protein
MKLITNFNTLKTMAKMNLIQLHEETKIFKYVYDGNSFFKYKNNTYMTKYIDGCFFPFIYQIKIIN